ncbi:MAG TPA: helix-hairpin-helix domain-containing protein [Oleiagrimonas sp.]|nr:helix-hairpin-helix domain-containing protein [Oleiagrimonas sp.]
MNPDKVVREHVRQFTDLPNIGPAMARDFAALGFDEPGQLAGADPLELYVSLCREKHRYQDPCVLDVFMSVTDFLAGSEAQPWWHFTEARKRRYAAAVLQARRDFALNIR